MEKSTQNVAKINVDLAYELHYNKQLLMKLLAHVIAERAHYGLHDDVPQDESKTEWVGRTAKELLKELNEHYAKVHLTQDEISDIKDIIEESKKFI